MKILRSLAALTALVLSLPASAALVTYTDSYYFTNNDNILSGNSTISWTHAVSPDFYAPATSALLTVSAKRATGANDFIYLDLVKLGALNPGNNNSANTISTVFGLDLYASSWIAGDLLHFSLNYDTPSGNNNRLMMESSILSISYYEKPLLPPPASQDDLPVPGAAIPEPGTVALFGLGLAGLLATRRKSRVPARA